MNSLVRKIEERLLPEFRKIVSRINQIIPNTSAKVEAHSFGFDEHLGHSIHISCLLTKDCFAEADNVALSVSISHLASKPTIDACVCWGHPSGYVEAEFPKPVEGFENNSLIITDEVLEDLYKDLPLLYAALFKALKRRKPGDE